jgi:hypothetical protein
LSRADLAISRVRRARKASSRGADAGIVDEDIG